MRLFYPFEIPVQSADDRRLHGTHGGMSLWSALFKIPDDRVDRRRFSGTRTARDYQKSAVDRLNHRADLQFIQLDLFLFLDDCQTFPNLFFRFGTSDV